MDPALYNLVHPLVVERQQRVAERNAAEKRIDELNGEIGALFVSNGIEKDRIDRWNVSVGTSTRPGALDEALLRENGVDGDVIMRSRRPPTTFSRVDVREVGAKS